MSAPGLAIIPSWPTLIAAPRGHDAGLVAAPGRELANVVPDLLVITRPLGSILPIIV